MDHLCKNKSHPARGAWIEIVLEPVVSNSAKSHPARGAWIEITKYGIQNKLEIGRTPQGVRGLKYAAAAPGQCQFRSHPARGAWIEILASVFGD